jgi:mannosyl-oligosaccharide alpha-1,2-mannosidase
VAEVATLQIEYKELATLTKDERFRDVALKITDHLHSLNKPDGLVPIYINPYNGNFVGHTVTLGARGDSYYEYLLKQWIQNGAKFEATADEDKEHFLINDWLESVKGMRSQLIRQTKPNNLSFVGEMLSGSFSPKMDHLVCFLPGNLALGAMWLGKSPKFPKSEVDSLMDLAKSLTETCYQMYAKMATGLSPEICYFNTFEGSNQDLYVKDADRHNLLRPETIESLYYMYKITGDTKYQDYGWKIFQSFEKYTKVPEGGYSSINDVTSPNNPRPRDKMESFFLAETLKYFYLLFEDASNENIDFNKWIFNTEAHLLPLRF